MTKTRRSSTSDHAGVIVAAPERPGSAVSARSLGAFGAQAAVHLRAGFDRSTLPMLIVDDQRQLVTGNAAALDLLGLAGHDVPWRHSANRV